MLREPVKRALVALGRTAPGKHVVHAATAGDRDSGRFRDASWPPKADTFEDLDFLFTSSQLNHGLASLRFDEAALFFRLVRALGRPTTIAELGRFKGGSTFLLAVAMAPGSELWSYDLHLETPDGATGEELDRELITGLERYGISGVHLVVADTRTVELPSLLDLLFVDADHSYEGVRADFDRWGLIVRPGGHLLFHDAVDDGGWGTVYPGIQRLVGEIEAARGPFRRARGAGTIAHFVRENADDFARPT